MMSLDIGDEKCLPRIAEIIAQLLVITPMRTILEDAPWVRCMVGHDVAPMGIFMRF